MGRFPQDRRQVFGDRGLQSDGRTLAKLRPTGVEKLIQRETGWPFGRFGQQCGVFKAMQRVLEEQSLKRLADLKSVNTSIRGLSIESQWECIPILRTA